MNAQEHIEKAMLHLEIAHLISKLDSNYHIKGEEKIAEILDELSVYYQQQYTFDDCINPKTFYKLRYDFFLPAYNLLIEYDEQHHYNDKDTKQRDEIKNQYAKDHNITLVRIPYTYYDKLTKDSFQEFLEKFAN